MELYGSRISNRAILAGDVKAPAAAAQLEAMLDKTSMHKDR
jgi:lipid-binding SYLF domain-containing protein